MNNSTLTSINPSIPTLFDETLISKRSLDTSDQISVASCISAGILAIIAIIIGLIQLRGWSEKKEKLRKEEKILKVEVYQKLGKKKNKKSIAICSNLLQC